MKKLGFLVIALILYSNACFSQYTMTADGNPVPVEAYKNFYQSYVSSSQGVEIKLTTTGTLGAISVSPSLKYTIPVSIVGKTATFQLPEKGYYVVYLNGTTINSSTERLFIFVDDPEVLPTPASSVTGFGVTPDLGTAQTTAIQAALNANAGTGNWLLFPPGTYLTGALNIPSNSKIFLQEGAIIKAVDNISALASTDDFSNNRLIMIYGSSNVEIAGLGMLDANGLYLRTTYGDAAKGRLFATVDANNVTVTGITLRDPLSWNTQLVNSDSITFRNVKVLNETSITNTDGIDPDASQHVLIEDCFVYSGDDNFAIKCTNGYGVSRQRDVDDIVIRGNVLLCQKSSLKIGTETRTTNITNVTFEDNDVIESDRALALYSYDGANLDNINYINNRIERNYPDSKRCVIYFEITVRDGMGSMKNVLVKNNTVLANFPNLSYLKGLDATHRIQVTIDNLTIAGTQVCNATDAHISANSFSDITWVCPTTYTLTTSTVGTGNVTLHYPGGTYASSDVVTVTAYPGSGYTFSSWSGDISGSANPSTITMTANKSIQANFVSVPTYTLSTSATNGSVTLNPTGGTYSEGAVVTVTASADLGYGFSSWSGDLSGSTNPTTITMDADKNVQAGFSSVSTYILSTSASNGSITLNPSGGTYNEGTVVTLTANADAGYAFSSWSGDLSGSTNPATITMDADKSVQADFNVVHLSDWIEDFDLSDGTTSDNGSTAWSRNLNAGTASVQSGRFDVTSTGIPGTTWTSEWININGGPVDIAMELSCAGADEAERNSYFEWNDSIQVYYTVYNGGTPVTTYIFKHGDYLWPDATVSATGITGDSIQINVYFVNSASNENWYLDSVRVTGVPITKYTLSTNATNGSITLSPPGGTYNTGTVVTMTVNPDLGFIFVAWSGDASGNTNPYIITVDADKTVEALFDVSTVNSKIFSDLLIYPTIVSDYLNIEYNISQPSKVKINISDVLGREVFIKENVSINYGMNEIKLNLSHLKPGIYIYAMEADAQVKIGRIVKK